VDGSKRKKGRRGRASASAIARAEREREAIGLRRAGASYDEIAARVGYADRSGAKKAVERGLSRWMRESDEELRALELERTEVIIARLWPAIDTPVPDLKAVEVFLRVAEYRAKIAGLYAPRRDRLEVSVHARVEHRKLEALRVLEADTEIAEVLEEYLDHPTPQVLDG
jgi:hypothetical protein